MTGWQPRSGRVAAAAAAPPPRPPAAPLAAAAAASAGRSFTPDPRSEPGPRAERGAQRAAATRRRLGAGSAPTSIRSRSLGSRQRPGLGAWRRRRGGCEPRPARSAAATQPASAPRAAAMAVRSRRPWMSVALGLVLGFTAASWLIAPRVAELSERKRRGSSLCSYYGRSAAGPGAQQPLPEPHARQWPGQSPPPARQELRGPQLPEAAPGVTSFRSSPWQQPPPLQQRRRGREPEGATGLPGAPVAEGEPEEEDGGAAGHRRSGQPGSSHNGSGDGGAAASSSRPRDFLYVGVMTAQKYLGSRALAAQRTWARFIPGRVEFFSSQQPPNAGVGQPPPPLPVIALPGVDDSYPPQKKSFMMIKYMHDHYLDKYEWFMRADDDVYIKGDLPAPAVPPPRLLSLQPAPIPAQPRSLPSPCLASLPARAPAPAAPSRSPPPLASAHHSNSAPPPLLRVWTLLRPAWLFFFRLPHSCCSGFRPSLAATPYRVGR